MEPSGWRPASCRGHGTAVSTPPAVYDVWTAQAVRVVYDGLLAYHYSRRGPAGARPRPGDLGARTHRRRPDLHLQPPARDQVLDRCRGARHPTSSAGCTARCSRPRARPDFYAGIIGGQACTDHPASCDLSKGVVADDAAASGDVPPRGPGPAVPLQAEPCWSSRRRRGRRSGRIAVAAAGHRALPDRLLSPPDKAFTLARNRYFHQWSAPAQPAGFVDEITWVKVRECPGGGGRSCSRAERTWPS